MKYLIMSAALVMAVPTWSQAQTPPPHSWHQPVIITYFGPIAWPIGSTPRNSPTSKGGGPPLRGCPRAGSS
jgi:hypothetical protein